VADRVQGIGFGVDQGSERDTVAAQLAVVDVAPVQRIAMAAFGPAAGLQCRNPGAHQLELLAHHGDAGLAQPQRIREQRPAIQTRSEQGAAVP